MSRSAVKALRIMRTHIDWLTFTLTMRYEGEGVEAYALAIRNGFVDAFSSLLANRVFAGNWQAKERSRAPYQHAYTDSELGVSVFSSPTLTHFCVEISGQGCERIIDLGDMGEVLSSIHERCTRIDIACDIETEVRPTEFVDQLTHERMRSSGYQKSNTGETCYVGSQKSDRYARVYRYNPPHPRSHLLRVEHVFRRENAKSVARSCCDLDLDNIAKAAGEAFGWGHKDWITTDGDSAELSPVRERGRSGQTIYWLVNSCAPAFKKLCKTGAISDPEKFIQTYFKLE